MTDTKKKKETLVSALCRAQATISGVKKSGSNPYFKSSYSDLSDVIEAIREPFYENGLCYTQTIEILESGLQALSTVLMHESGETIKSQMILPQQLDPQKMGSLITYYRRYSLMAICGIAPEDDDGNSVTKKTNNGSNVITEEQWKALDEFLNGYEELRDELKRLCKVRELRFLKVNQLQACRDFAKKWIKNKEESDLNS